MPVSADGDFDFLSLFGRDRTHSEVATWLAALLDVPPPALCDSAVVAGVMELYRAQGIWSHSFRLAIQDVLAESMEEMSLQPLERNGRAVPLRSLCCIISSVAASLPTAYEPPLSRSCS